MLPQEMLISSLMQNVRRRQTNNVINQERALAGRLKAWLADEEMAISVRSFEKINKRVTHCTFRALWREISFILKLPNYVKSVISYKLNVQVIRIFQTNFLFVSWITVLSNLAILSFCA